MTKACSVYLTGPAQSKVSVSLSSNNAAVVVKATTVTVNLGASTAGFSLAISTVSTAQTATVTGTLSGTSKTFTLSLNPTTSPALTVSSASIAFGNVVLNTPVQQGLTLTSAGSAPLVISAASVSGTGFSVSGASFPMTLNPGQSTTFNVSFDPAAAGSTSGSLTVTSNASSASISLSGTGVPILGALSCGATALVGPTTTSCTVALNAAAPSGGQSLTLTSSNSAVTVPSSINAAAGATSAAFVASIGSVTSSQSATVTATAAGVSKSIVLQAQSSTPTLAISSTNVSFGNVALNTTAKSSVTLTSTGTSPVTASGATLTGTAFTVTGGTFPVTLAPGQSLTLNVLFDPTAAGAATGQLTIASNSSSGSSAVINFSGTGTQASAGATYYLAPASANGKDSNNGLSISTPWLSPKHALNCGDVIIALASTQYDSTNFNTGHWGTVSCPNGNNVAWLQCETFDGCKISTSVEGIYVDHSYWGVQGWEVSIVGGVSGFCFGAAPTYSNPTNIHHIIFANNIANGCRGGGFVTFNVGTTGVDYINVIGNIVFSANQGNDECYSGISLYQPVQFDWASGTHLYIAGNFAWDNFQPDPCGGVQPWGGDGLIFDTLDGSQGGMPNPYAAQAVAENNIFIGNGGHGIEVQNNVAGSVHAPIILANNTVWGNEASTYMQPAALCAEVLLNSAYNVQETSNLVATKAQKACIGNAEYALSAYEVDGTDTNSTNFAFGYNNQNTWVWDGPNFSYNSNNITGQDPVFTNPTVPGAPACGGSGNVAACMASVINNFTPTNSAAISSGYRRASSTPVNDPLFPQWVCNANLPAGLMTLGCAQ